MPSSIGKFLIAAGVLLAAHAQAHAGSLQVEPVLIDVSAPGAASTITLRNEGTAPINVQIRLFRWSQVEGKEHLETTNDVVASPPAITVTPKTNYVARVVRVTKRPVSGEESYRVLIDQLPAPTQERGNAVHLLVRLLHSGFLQRLRPAGSGGGMGKSRMEWTAPASGIASNGAISISAQGDTGPIEAVSSIGSGK